MKTVSTIIKISDGDLELYLYYSYPEEVQGPFPTILIFPTWAGQDPFCQHKAHLFSQKGYLAIVIDLYGKGQRGTTPEECQALMGPFVENRTLLKHRIALILKHLLKDPLVDKTNIVGLGYCFGGLGVLDALRNNLGLKAGVVIHGLYSLPGYEISKKYEGKILVLHGYKDPLCPPSSLMALQEELGEACEDWQLISFGLGKHAFTNPEACDENRGTVFNGLLDKRTSHYVDFFLQETLERSGNK